MTTVDVICYKYKPLKTGELPLKIRVCKDRKTRYINLGVSTKAEYWDFGKNQPKPTCPNRELIEKLISNKISEVKSKIVELKSGKQKLPTSLENQEFTAICFSSKWCHRESNQGHKDFQSFALPPCISLRVTALTIFSCLWSKHFGKHGHAFWVKHYSLIYHCASLHLHLQ